MICLISCHSICIRGCDKDVSIEETNERELDWIQKSGGNGKPVIVSEFGAAAIYGFRDRSHCKWSEERQADIIRENLDVYMKNEAICGVFWYGSLQIAV